MKGAISDFLEISPTSVMSNIRLFGTQSDIRDERNRTEPDNGTYDIRLKGIGVLYYLDIGFDRYPISDVHGIPVDFVHRIP
jgi:hypothetical protein